MTSSTASNASLCPSAAALGNYHAEGDRDGRGAARRSRGRPDVEIEQTYLLAEPGTESAVRRRGQRGNYTYTHTIKRPLRAGQRVEGERPISGREYVGLLAQADPAARVIRKRRTCFLFRGQYFELDRFEEPSPGQSESATWPLPTSQASESPRSRARLAVRRIRSPYPLVTGIITENGVARAPYPRSSGVGRRAHPESLHCATFPDAAPGRAEGETEPPRGGVQPGSVGKTLHLRRSIAIRARASTLQPTIWAYGVSLPPLCF